MGEETDKKASQLESLNQQLDAVKKFQPDAASSTKLPGDAARAAIDFASATAVGTLLGYGFDYWQHTLPWGLLVGLLIGTATGVKLMFDEEARQRRKSSEKNDND